MAPGRARALARQTEQPTALLSVKKRDDLVPSRTISNLTTDQRKSKGFLQGWRHVLFAVSILSLPLLAVTNALVERSAYP